MPASGVGSYKFHIRALKINATDQTRADFGAVSEHSIYVSSTAYPGGSAQERIAEVRDVLAAITSDDRQVNTSIRIALESINHCLLE